MKIIKNVQVYAPESLGKKDLLIGGGVILHIADEISWQMGDIEEIDGSDKIAVPGYIDPHVHITGGGGEGGMRTRVPEIMLSELVGNGITTVVGMLGTDSVTRNVEGLVAKAKALNEEGITAYALTGAYAYPSPTITGSLKRDIVFIDEVIGVKIALSDHRDSRVNDSELSRLVADVRTASMIGGKAGIVTIHMGNGKEGLDPIVSLIKETDIPPKHLLPTHINRNPELLKAGLDFARKGGYIDLSASKKPGSSPASIIASLAADFPFERITFSSDGNGSASKYDPAGNCTSISAMSVDTIPYQIKTMIMEYGLSVDKAVRFATENPAKRLGVYPKKGTLKVGSDADLLLLDSDFEIDTVIAKGERMMQGGKILAKGTYEYDSPLEQKDDSR